MENTKECDILDNKKNTLRAIVFYTTNGILMILHLPNEKVKHKQIAY